MGGKRGLLKPLKVTWRLSQAATGFQLAFCECDFLRVSGLANCEPDADGTFSTDDRRVYLGFDSPAHVRILAAIGTKESVDLHDYEYWYEHDVELKNQFNEHTRELYIDWYQTGICPDPWAYEVTNSALLRELDPPSGRCKEYLLVGDDYSIIVVSHNYQWSWESGGLEGQD